MASELSREQIEALRRSCQYMDVPFSDGGGVAEHNLQVNALCDMALRALPLPPLATQPGWKLLKDSTQEERSFEFDDLDENGNYYNCCAHCLRMFVGHKRRVICKVCEQPQPPKERV